MQQVNKEKTKPQTFIPEIHISRKGTTLCSTVQTTVQTDSLFGNNTLFANAQGINVFAMLRSLCFFLHMCIIYCSIPLQQSFILPLTNKN